VVRLVEGEDASLAHSLRDPVNHAPGEQSEHWSCNNSTQVNTYWKAPWIIPIIIIFCLPRPNEESVYMEIQFILGTKGCLGKLNVCWSYSKIVNYRILMKGCVMSWLLFVHLHILL